MIRLMLPCAVGRFLHFVLPSILDPATAFLIRLHYGLRTLTASDTSLLFCDPQLSSGSIKGGYYIVLGVIYISFCKRPDTHL
jgi:hypothetical protein